MSQSPTKESKMFKKQEAQQGQEEMLPVEDERPKVTPSGSFPSHHSISRDEVGKIAAPSVAKIDNQDGKAGLAPRQQSDKHEECYSAIEYLIKGCTPPARAYFHALLTDPPLPPEELKMLKEAALKGSVIPLRSSGRVVIFWRHIPATPAAILDCVERLVTQRKPTKLQERESLFVSPTGSAPLDQFFNRPAEMVNADAYVTYTKENIGAGQEVLISKISKILSDVDKGRYSNTEPYSEVINGLRDGYLDGDLDIKNDEATGKIIHDLSKHICSAIYRKLGEQKAVKNNLFQLALPNLALCYSLGDGVEKDDNTARLLQNYFAKEEEVDD